MMQLEIAGGVRSWSLTNELSAVCMFSCMPCYIVGPTQTFISMQVAEIIKFSVPVCLMWLTSERLSLIIALMSPIASGALSSSNAATSIKLIKRAKHGRRRIAGRLGMLNALTRWIFPSVTKVTCPWQSSSVIPNNANSSIVHLRTLAASFRRSGSYSVVMRIRLTNVSSLTFYVHLISGQFLFLDFSKNLAGSWFTPVIVNSQADVVALIFGVSPKAQRHTGSIFLDAVLQLGDEFFADIRGTGLNTLADCPGQGQEVRRR